MVARLLNLCGVFLGPECELMQAASDNPEGFWENVLFVNLNNGLLHRLGGSWHEPPRLEADWPNRPEFDEVKQQARALIARLEPQRPWGWKDPRTTLTLAFWQELLPELKIVVCLRSPHDVGRSLAARGERLPFLDLWLDYNCRVLAATRPEQRIVTHYESYFHEPQAELRRVLGWLGIEPQPAALEQAAATIRQPLKHHETSMAELVGATPGTVLDCYMELCGEAGPVFADWLGQRPLDVAGCPRVLGTQRDQPLVYRDAVVLYRLEQERARLAGDCTRLEEQCRELTDKVQAAHHLLAEANSELEGVARSRAWQALNYLKCLFRPGRKPR